MNFRRLAMWELLEFARNPFVGIMTSSLALATYVLVYVYGQQRFEYFTRIAFAIVPIGFAFLAQPHTKVAEARFDRLLATTPLPPARLFWARLAGVAGAVAAYLGLVTPLAAWHVMHFPGRADQVTLGALGAFLLGLSAYLLARLAARWASQTPVFGITASAILLFAAVNFIALMGFVGFVGDSALVIAPSVAAGRVSQSFVDSDAPPWLALLVLVLTCGLLACLARRAAAPARGALPLALVVTALLLVASALAGASAHAVPYSSMTTVSGGFSVDVRGVTPLEIGKTSTVTVVLRDPSNPGATAREVDLSGEGLAVDVEPSSIRNEGDRVEVPAEIRPLPLDSAKRQIYILHIVWTQDNGDVKSADELILGTYKDFATGIRLGALAVLAGFAPAIMRKRALSNESHVISTQT